MDTSGISFVGCSFYSLEAVYGGALHLAEGVIISNCHFANNTAENGNGNDIFIEYDNNVYNSDPSYFQATCSLSLSPGRFISYGV